MKALMTIALIVVALPASALVSVDGCVPECEAHQLQWRPSATDAWQDVGGPMPLENVIRPDDGSMARGVDWTGVSTYGDFQAKATRGIDESPYSPPLHVGEPPAPPLLIAAIATVAVLRKRRS